MRILRSLAALLCLMPAVALGAGASLPPIPNPLPIAKGGTGYQLPRLAAALLNSRYGIKSTRVCAAGDSTTYGVGSNGSQTGNLPPLSYPVQLSGFLTSKYGFKSHWNAWQGDQGAYQTLANDSRVTLGSSWSQSPLIGIGGALVTATTATNALSFAPTTAVDTFRVLYATGPSFGVLSVNVDGGTATAITTTAAGEGFASAIITAPSVGTHTLNLSWSSGGSVNVSGVEAWDSTQSWVSVVNAGWSGSTAVNWSTSGHPWSPADPRSWAALQCDVVLLDLGINDWYYSSGVTAYTTAMQAIIGAASLSSDVVLLTPVPTASSSTAISAQLPYLTAIYGLSKSYSITLIDNYSRWQSFINGNSFGLYQDGFTHPNARGYGDFALNVLTGVMPSQFSNAPLGQVNVGNSQVVGSQSVEQVSNSSQGTTYTLSNSSTNGQSYQMFTGGSASSPGFWGLYNRSLGKTPIGIFGTNTILTSGGYYAWTTDGNFAPNGTPDIGLTRVSPGVLKAWNLQGANFGAMQANIILPKLGSVPGAGPGAGFAYLLAVPGTNSGTCKIITMAGTSATPVVLADNVGSGC